jgi:uncharacterized protein YgiM (DUF1202 family)
LLKKAIMLWCVAVLLTAAAGAQVRQGQTVYINAKSVALKSGTGFFARTVGTLQYGDTVTVLQTNGKWVELRSGSRVSGWTAQTNVTTKRIAATGGSGAASSREVAMAGKGFNEEVEQVYRESSGIDYSGVDAVEALRVSDDDLLRFITEGRLSMGDE